MTRCYGYARVSSTKQGEGVSLDEQRSAISSYATKHGLKVVEWFEEKETAAKRGRPVFRDVLKRLRKGEADGLIIHKIDRSARNLRDWADLNEFMDRGAIHFAHESLDLTTRGGRLAADIQAVVAADYIRNLRDETRKGHRGRLKQGLFPFGAPLGYLDAGPGVPKKLDPVASALVREAFEVYAGGGVSLEALSDQLFLRGLRTKGGGRVHKPYLARILRNPFYAGTIKILRSGETFDGAHEPLLPWSLFDQVQRLLDGKAIKGPVRRQHLYRRLFHCAKCQRCLVGERQKGRVYYRCHAKDCPSATVREDAVTRAVLTQLARIRFSEEEMAYMGQQLEAERKHVRSQASRDLERLERELGSHESRLKRLTMAYVDGELDQEMFTAAKEDLLERKARTAEQWARLMENPAAKFDVIHEALELAASAQQSFHEGNDAEKRSLVETVSSNRWLDGKELSVELQFPFSAMANSPCVPSVRTDQNTVRTFRELDDILQHLWS